MIAILILEVFQHRLLGATKTRPNENLNNGPYVSQMRVQKL